LLRSARLGDLGFGSSGGLGIPGGLGEPCFARLDSGISGLALPGGLGSRVAWVSSVRLLLTRVEQGRRTRLHCCWNEGQCGRTALARDGAQRDGFMQAPGGTHAQRCGFHDGLPVGSTWATYGCPSIHDTNSTFGLLFRRCKLRQHGGASHRPARKTYSLRPNPAREASTVRARSRRMDVTPMSQRHAR
jgi:hypothetical protein